MDIRGRLANGIEGVFAVDLAGRLIISGSFEQPSLLMSGLVANASHVMQGVVVGTGTLSVGRTSPIWARDADYVYHEFGSGELAWEGGRVTGAVGSRVVYDTDSGGTEYAVPPCLIIAPTAENLCFQSNAVTTSPWAYSGTAAAVQNISGLFGANTGWTITDNDAGTSAGVQQSLSISTDNAPYVFRFWVPKTTGAGFHPRAQMLFSGGSAVAEYLFYINTDTGAHNTPPLGTMDVYDDGGPFWQVLCRLTDTGSNNSLLVRFQSSSHTGNFVNNVLLEGSSGFCQGEVYKNATIDFVKYLPPLPTTTTSGSRVADTYTYNSVNLNSASGDVYVEANMTQDSNIVSSFLARASNLAYLTDGANNVSGPTIPLDSWQRIGAAWDDTALLMAVNVEGSWSSDQSFDGGMLSGVFDLARNAPGVIRLRNIQTYEVPDV